MLKYQHGGDVKRFSKEINCLENEVIDLSSNINFIKPNINVDFNNLNISSYPDYEELEKSIASLYNIPSSQLELFNGATSAISTLFKSLKLTHCTLYSPLYLEYEKSARLHNYTLVHINRFEEIYQKVEKNSFIIFVNPSTPDGKFYNIDKLMKLWIKQNCTILIDESFLDFTPFNSVIGYLKRYNKLYILKSMTKFYSAAGIRIGLILSNKENIQGIKALEPLWKISQFDSHYLQSALQDKSFSQRSKDINNINKNYLINILKNSTLIETLYPSDVNFIMIKLYKINAKEFQEKLIKHKIMIRDCSNFKFLTHNYVRIDVKKIENLQELEKIL